MTEQENTPKGYCVILESYPADKKVSVIKVVRELTGLGLKEAKDLVEMGAPVVLTNIVLEVAYISVGKLMVAGASAYIRLVDDMGDPDDGDPDDKNAQATPGLGVSDEGTRDPIDIIGNRLGRARATVDILCEITSADDTYGLLEEFASSTLSWIFHDIRNRIDEANEAATALHDQYCAAKSGGAA